LIADSMGLGKTCQALTYLQHHPELRPAIITVPASLKLNWAKEIKLWMSVNYDFHIISGRHSQRERLPKADIYIINYDILSVSNPDAKKKSEKYVCRPDILGIEPKIVIADEAHVWKSPDAQRTKAMMDLAKRVPYFIALTGTPIVNRPIEIYNCIKAIEPKLFPSYFQYAMKYCGAKHNGYGWNFNGASNTQELHEKLSSIMIRRKKEEVLKDLPPKIRTVIPMELDNQREYNTAEADLIGWLRINFGNGKAEKAQQAEALARIGELKRLAVRGKLKGCIEWIEDFLESGEKLVVFAVHKFVIDALMEHFTGKAVKIDGSVSNRQAPVDAFQDDDSVRLFIGNIQAAGVGITLTKASNTCFLELGFSPSLHEQAEDRVHRIGQTADSVTAWYLLAAGTMEEEIAELIDAKRKIVAKVIDGQDIDEESLLSELMKKYI
ncbi:MAG: DEAD/DEAH box helicase, partial [Patescibacteria group bacterium]